MKFLITFTITLSLLLVSVYSEAKNPPAVRVAVIDGEPNLALLKKNKVPLCNRIQVPSVDNKNGLSSKHALNVVLTIVDKLPNNGSYCIEPFPIFQDIDTETGVIQIKQTKVAINEAIDKGYTHINMSLGGKANRDDGERLAILRGLVRGVTFILSSGNEGEVLTQESCKDMEYMGCYALIPSWKKYIDSGKLIYVGHWAQLSKQANKISGMQFEKACSIKEGIEMCGTSQSTAHYTNALLLRGLYGK